MKKITEIYIEKEYLKSERDEFGNRIKVPTSGKFKRDPIVVGHWRRIGHYVLDYLVIIFLAFILGIVLYIISPQLVENLDKFSLKINLIVFKYDIDLFGYGLLVLYYFVSEILLQRTIGKFATNTIVIDEYGNKPSNKAIFIRSISRLIPFEPLSCLGERGWHDTISKTFVVSVDEAKELKRLLNDEQANYVSDSLELLD